MYFYVEYANTDTLRMPWSHDLQNSEAYHTFCTQRQELRPLLMSSAQLLVWLRKTRQEQITHVKPKQTKLADIV